MAVTATRSIRQVVTQALRLSGVAPVGDSPAPEDAEFARVALDDMLKAWQGQGYNLWTVAAQSLTLTTAAVYTLDPVRPLDILGARLKRNGLETPMHRLTRQAYDDLPNKASRGLPVNYHYDRQREAARFIVWPVLAAANGETVEITYSREMEDVASLNGELDLPAEWWDAVTYSLASRLIDAFGVQDRPLVVTRAEALLQDALGFDREGSVFFMPDH